MQLNRSSSLDRRFLMCFQSVNSNNLFIELQRKMALICADIMPNGWDPILLHFPACKNVESNMARARATKIHRILQREYLEI